MQSSQEECDERILEVVLTAIREGRVSIQEMARNLKTRPEALEPTFSYLKRRGILTPVSEDVFEPNYSSPVVLQLSELLQVICRAR